MSLIALVSVFILYLVVSFVALFTYGAALDKNIISNITESTHKNFLDYILLISFLLITGMHIPIVFFVGKEALLIIVDEARRKTISKS